MLKSTGQKLVTELQVRLLFSYKDKLLVERNSTYQPERVP